VSPLTIPRTYAAGSVVGGSWWITGGDYGAIDNSEILEFNSNAFISYKNLPTDFNSHCQVTVDENTVFLGAEGTQAYLYDFPSETFTALRSIDVARSSHACGVVRGDSGLEIVVAGDETSR
jgi:hypothetical protein